jgi:hypothetical protein
MLLYCGGDYHVAGAQAANNCVKASDDPRWKHLGNLPHPDNLRVAWPRRLADTLKATLTTGNPAESSAEIVADVEKWTASSLESNRSELLAIVGWPVMAPSCHDRIWSLHQSLLEKNIPHIFYNTSRAFFRVKKHYDWGASYMGPYDRLLSYTSIVGKDHATVSPTSSYFGEDGHRFWAQYMLKYVMSNI